jgi:ABC-2 type transport system ATP-binding protein
MDEAERVADELIIMDHGTAIARGTPRSVIDSLGAENILSFRLENGARGPDADTFASLPGVVATREDVGIYSLTAREAHRTVPALYDHLKKEGLALASLETHRPTLEDVFVSLTGRHLRDA